MAEVALLVELGLVQSEGVYDIDDRLGCIIDILPAVFG